LQSQRSCWLRSAGQLQRSCVSGHIHSFPRIDAIRPSPRLLLQLPDTPSLYHFNQTLVNAAYATALHSLIFNFLIINYQFSIINLLMALAKVAFAIARHSLIFNFLIINYQLSIINLSMPLMRQPRVSIIPSPVFDHRSSGRETRNAYYPKML